jgi:hypothetical protein
VGISSVFFASCGGSSNSTGPSTTTQPTPAVTPAASPSVSPSPPPIPPPSPTPTVSPTSSPWLQVRERQSCPYPDCPAEFGFAVDEQGFYFIRDELRGNITLGELGQINAIASVVASQSELGFSCVDTPTFPGTSDVIVDLTLDDGSTETVYQVNTTDQQTCFVGSLENAKGLYQTINTLAIRYDTESQPSPSPSSSPSPSASPSPSISPSSSPSP